MATRLSVPMEETRPEPLLPKELFFVYLVAPILAAPLLLENLFAMSGSEAQSRMLGILVPFGALTLTLHPLYQRVMPRLLSRLRAPAARAALHVAVITLVPSVIAAAIFPLHLRLCGGPMQPHQFILVSVVISALMIFPAMWVQGQRNEIARQVQRTAAERQAALRAQLEALQARTNPHFFFNSINTVASLIVDNPALAEQTLERLSDLFRYALDSARVTSVPLSTEFEMLRDFLAIQAARFGDRLTTEVQLDAEIESVQVPPLLLQPLVENAVLHGLSQRKGGHVSVKAWREGKNVRIEIADDGPGPGESQHRGSQTSVRDLTQRLRLTFGEGAELLLRPGPSGGCLASMCFSPRPL